MKKVIFTLSLICSTVFLTQSKNINKEFTFCKALPGDENPREWHRERNQKVDGKKVYQYCKEVYINAEQEKVATSLNGTEKYGFGGDCEATTKPCLTAKQ